MEAVQQLASSSQLRCGLLRRVRIDVIQSDRDFELSCEFGQRSGCDWDVMAVSEARAVRVSFGYVRGHRNGSASHLLHQPVLLGRGNLRQRPYVVTVRSHRCARSVEIAE